MNLLRRASALFRRAKLDREMDDELRFHIDEQTRANVAAGMSPDEAALAARKQFGWRERIRIETREARGWIWLENLARHFRVSMRALRRSPGFTATALATLAICLGANLSIFAVVDAILVRSLPFPEADRLVVVFNGYPNIGYPRTQTSIANYFDRRDAIKAFASVALQRDDAVMVGGGESPTRVPMAQITPEFFATLGVSLAMGHAFSEDELVPGADRVAVITDGFWRGHFNGDAQVLGRTFLNDDVSITVIGVLPQSFRFLSSPAEFYRPASHPLEWRQPAARHMSNHTMIARLAPDATIATAQTEIDAFNVHQAEDDIHPEALKSMGYHTVIAPLRADHVRTVRPALVLLQCGALFLLLIGGVNLANLLLIRASSRTKELAVRRALGATPRHIACEVLLETTLLALGGSALGLLLAANAVHLLRSLGLDQLPLGADVVLDGRVAAIALGATVLVGVLLAAPIIWFSLHAKLAPGLQTESRGGTASRAAQRLRHGFIVAQIALAFVLLSGAALLGVSLERVLRTPTGFNADHLLTGMISMPGKNYADNAARLALIERLLPALRALPGVTLAAVNNYLPFTNVESDRGIGVEGYTRDSGENLRVHHFCAVSGDYWAALGIPLCHGRLLDDADNHRARRVCVIDEIVAAHYWPGASALGHRIEFGDKVEGDNAITIVGVVASVKQNELTESADIGAIYVPCSQYKFDAFSVIARSALPPATLAPMMRETILRLDPTLLLGELKTMESRIDDSVVTRRSSVILASVFAGVALLLAAIGTYGVLAFAVNQRRREIGVRMALGALPRHVLAQFLRLGTRLIVVGLALGVPGAWAAGRAMQSLLFEVGALHVGVLATTAAVMIVVVFLAMYLPSRRAARVNPVEALRAE